MRTFPIQGSQTIATIGWDPATSILTVAFKSGGTYEYENVDGGTAAGVLFAPSIGSAFHAAIKKQPAKFPYRKIADARPVVSPADVAPCPSCDLKTRSICSTCLGLGHVPAAKATTAPQ